MKDQNVCADRSLYKLLSISDNQDKRIRLVQVQTALIKVLKI